MFRDRKYTAATAFGPEALDMRRRHPAMADGGN